MRARSHLRAQPIRIHRLQNSPALPNGTQRRLHLGKSWNNFQWKIWSIGSCIFHILVVIHAPRLPFLKDHNNFRPIGETPERELAQYMEEPQCQESPLIYWEQNRGRYPSLSKYALSILSVPASSAPVERLFSQSGLLLRPHRLKLTPKIVDQLIRVKQNKKYI